METIEFIALIFGSTMASSGFWALLQGRSKKYDKTTRLIIGLAHERIVNLASAYINRGSMNLEDFDTFRSIYEPYSEFEPNGVARRLKDEVYQLRLDRSPLKEERTHESTIRDIPNSNHV